MYLKIYFIGILFSTLAIAGCSKRLSTQTAVQQHIEDLINEPLEPIIIPSDEFHEAYAGVRRAHLLSIIYKRNGHYPLWFEGSKPTHDVEKFSRVIASARRFGLMPQHYHLQEITMLRQPSLDVEARRLDILLTDAFLSFVVDLKGGRSAKRETPLDSTIVYTLVDSMRNSGIMNILQASEPPFEGYFNLKAALNNLLDSIPDDDRNLLMQGITDDAIEAHRIVRKIEINMERWRSEKLALGNRHVWINIPAFMFYVYEDSHTVMTSRVVVGAPSSPTPEFSSNIECFTIFPYWYVPRKITVQEYLPAIKKDTTFITRNNFDVLDKSGKIVALSSIDWQTYHAKNFPFTLRQREGNENSLGIVKFIFDNPYAVFVHDTNSKRLFQHPARAYSHGCIRLERAFEFAHYLIEDGRSKATHKEIDKYLAEQKRTTISLLNVVPIHIRYFTAEVRNDKLEMYRDIYGKDQVLANRLYGLIGL